jgi:hypothetical protein
MSTHRTLIIIGGALALLLAACAPAPQAIPTQPQDLIEASATPGLVDASAAATATEAPPAADSANPTPAAVATSRGPNLEASDPSAVNLASGGPQLVEFFRFT